MRESKGASLLWNRMRTPPIPFGFGGGIVRLGKRPEGEEPQRIGLVYLSFLALAVGVVTGYGAVAFRDLIGLIHNIFFLGKFSFAYDASLFTPASRWGAFVILAPVVGAFAVTFLVSNFAPEAKGHGVPEVMDAIY